MEKRKNIDEDFQGNYYSRAAKGVYRIGNYSRWLMKWMAYFIGYCEKIIYFDLMASVLSAFKWKFWMVEFIKRWRIKDIFFTQP